MSIPLGHNAIMALGSPWTSAIRTKVSVSATTATALPTTPLANRKGLYLFNPSTVNVTIGPSSDLAATNEAILFPKAGLFIPASDAVTIYGFSTSGTVTIDVWEYTA